MSRNTKPALIKVAERMHVFFPSSVFCFILFYVLSPALSVSQVREYRFQNITVEDGLPSNLVTCIVQDKRGFIWLGTSAGLVRYDGYTMKVFTSILGDSTSIPNDYVTTMAVGRTGNLWIGNIEGGLSELRIPDEKFQRFKMEDSPLRMVSAILEDKKGMLWVGTAGDGVYLMDSSRTILRRLDHDLLNSNDIYDLADAHDGKLLAGTSKGLSVIDIGHHHAVVYRHSGTNIGPSSDTVRSILVEGGSKVWIGTDRGLDSFDFVSGAFIRGVAGHNLVSVVRAHDLEYLWLGTFNGLERFNRVEGTTTMFLHDEANRQSLLGNSILDVLVDNQGITWIATDHGVSRITSRALQFNFYTQGASSSNKFVSAIAEDRQGDIWVGSIGLKKNGKDKGVASMLKNKYVASLHCDQTGNLWIGTYSGLFRLPAGSLKCESVLVGFGITSMAEDLEEILWLGTSEGALYGLNKRTLRKDYEFRSLQDGANGFQTENIIKISVDRNNVVWVGTEGSGLFRLDRVKKQFKQFMHDPSLTGTISNNRVYDVFEDRSGVLWVTTGEGLDAMDRSMETFSHLGKENGFPSSSVLNINEDNSGNLWITADGPWISKFDLRTRRITNYYSEDGFHHTSLMGAFIKTSRGEFIIGGLDGFTRFYPDRIVDHISPPVVQLTELILAGTPKAFNPSWMQEGLKFSYSENFLGFSFATLDYTNPKRNRHAYQLKGVDDDWRYVEGSRHINYANLAPGSYTLRIKGRNSDGYWNEEAISLPFTISPPWWETWYFRIGVIAMVSFVFLALHRVRVTNLLERERLKAKISAELHDEIGSGLTRIALLSEIALRSALEKEGHSVASVAETPGERIPEQSILKIGTVARELHEALSDVVWSINPLHDTMESFIHRSTKYLNEACEARGISLHLDIGNEIASLEARPEMLHSLLLVTKEAITNTVRHSQCSNVSVQIHSKAGRIDLTISDDGRGFEAGTPFDGNGLRNIKKRIDQLSGELSIQSACGRGTTIFCSIPSGKGQKRIL